MASNESTLDAFTVAIKYLYLRIAWDVNISITQFTLQFKQLDGAKWERPNH